MNNDIVNNGIFEVVNALDYNQIEHLIEQYEITDVYLMAALLSATAEKTCLYWDLNMNSLFHVLNLAKAGKIKDILAIKYCCFCKQHQRKIRHNIPLWNLQLCMELVNKPAKVRILP
jgi:nucleoside-diphosphate-sugar epimerase